MDLQQAILNRSHYYKNLKQRLDAHNDKVSSSNLRNKWLKAQKNANYQNEYDRIRSELERTIIPATKQYLRERQSFLIERGAKVIDKMFD